MLPIVVLIAATVLTVRGLDDDRKAVFALGLAIGTNAAGVLGVVYGWPDFLLPMAAVLLIAGVVRGRGDNTTASSVSPGAVVGPALLVAVFVAAAIGPFVADAASASAFAVSRLTRDIVVVAAIVANARRPAAITSGLAGFTVGTVLMAAITIVQSLADRRAWSFGGFGAWTVHQFADIGFVPRAAGPFIDDPNSYAQYLSIGVLAAIGLAIAATEPRRRAGWAVAAGWVTIALLLTRSRSGLVALLLVAGGWLVLSRRPKHIAGALTAGAAVLLFTPLAAFSRLGTLTSAASQGQASADTSVLGRTSEARAALEMFVDNPLTGVGFGAYPSEYLHHARRIGLDARFEPRSAHSLPLEVAAEQGLIGLAAWTALAAFAVVTIRALRRERPRDAAPLALGMGALAASSLFLHDVHPRAMWMLIGLAIGASIWLNPAPEPTTTPSARLPVRPERERLMVAMVIQNYVPALGGAERQLANLAPLMAQRGIEPVVITRRFPGRPHRDEIDGIRVIRVRTWGPKPLRSALFVAGALYHLSRLGPDVVHAYDTLSPSTIALAHRARSGTPVAVKLLRSGPLGDLDRLARRPGGVVRRRRLLDEVDVFVAISSDIDHELARAGVDRRRRIYLPNGVDATRFRPAHPSARWQDDGPLVIASGRLAPEKRLVELADRWERVRAVHPAARLVLVGDGPQRHLLEGRRGIELRGQIGDLAPTLRMADLYVSASAAEGLSNALLEAMASGLACVVTDVGGVRDLIKNDEQGVVVPADDLDALVDEVTELLRDPVRRRATGAAARARVADGWALTTTADRLVALYRRLATPTVSTAPVEHARMVTVE